MTTKEQTDIRNLLDHERQTIVYPGVTRVTEWGVVKDLYDGGEQAEIIYCACSAEEVDAVIQQQIDAARREHYALEWKLYTHDQPACLADRLTAAGFEAEDREAFLVCRVHDSVLEQFGPCDGDIRRVTTAEGLKDVQLITEEVNGRSMETPIAQWAFLLENHPENISLYVAYVDGEPAACGRIYFHPDSRFAGLYGGNTRPQFRKRGLFTQLVATRLREAQSRGISLVSVDALPTSEPILRKRGFEVVTYTQPFSLAN